MRVGRGGHKRPEAAAQSEAGRAPVRTGEAAAERGNRGPGRMRGGHKRPEAAAQSGAARLARSANPTRGRGIPEK